MLDESLRARLRTLALRDSSRRAPALDAAARERVVAAVRARGPAMLRRARWSGAAVRLAVPVLVAAAVVALVLRATLKDAPVASPANRPTEASAVTAACAKWHQPALQKAPFVVEGATKRLQLGRLGLVASPNSAEVRLAKLTNCDTVIELSRGQVAVRADELGGGTLRVDVGQIQVSVRGTLFLVERDGARVSVDVVEGVVTVEHGSRTESVRAGQRLTITRVGTARGELLPERRSLLLELVQGQSKESQSVIRLDSLDPAAAETLADVSRDLDANELAHPSPAARPASPASEVAPVGDDVLARAERLRRSGDYEAARGLYRRAGAGASVTAEAAWLALARMELALGRTDAARQAAADRRDRFGRGSLGPEAQWLEVRIHRQAGQDDTARQVARDLIVRWPTSPQAAAAQRWLDSP